ncbi:nascent polypeptide-associated complex protein [Thermoproteota archaeon]
MDSRRARRMMKQMGVNMNELGDIKRVILQGDKREIIIEGAQVTSINVQGTKMYQIAGGRETEGKPSTETVLEEKAPLEIPEEDILLVAQQANVGIDVARKTLEESEGDLAQAIIKLQTR